jgi:uncharacterized membrane protein YdjX (TVP38/TMEM64 family)
LGSALAFFLGKVFGKRLVRFVAGKEACNKWRAFLNRCKYSFVVMMILPFFPDDILCLVAGLTDMSWSFFMATQFVARPIGIFLVSFFASGEIIPYHGWGLLVWAVIFGSMALLFYLSVKFKDKIDHMIKNLDKKKR